MVQRLSEITTEYETDEQYKKFVETLNRWKWSPYLFVQECLGVNEKNGLAISDQQKEFLDALPKIAEAKSKIWDWEHKIGPYYKDELEKKYQSIQIRKNSKFGGEKESKASKKRRLEEAKAKILEDMKPSKEEFEMSSKRGISIMSGKGTGKDCSSAWMILWFLCFFRKSRIVCTSPSRDHLKQVLWAEVTKWYNMTDRDGNYMFIFRDWIEIESEKIFNVNYDKPGKAWFAIQISPKKDANPEALKGTLGGQHDDNMIILCDESSAIPDAVFEAFDSTMTSRRNFAVLLFNPLIRTGFAHDTHYKGESERWVKLQWNAEESNIVSKDFIESSLKKYGSRDNDSYRVYVRGLPPTGGEGTLIPFDWIYWAQKRELQADKYQGIILGVDPAGEGKDRTMVAVRKGVEVLEMVNIPDHETIAIVEKVMRVFKQYKAEAICVDSIGVGKGVYDVLNNICSKVYSVKVSESPRKEGYFDYRAELWWRMREVFEKGDISISNDPQLFEELAAPQYENAKGRIRIEPKKSIKKRLGRSPDKADALLLTFHLDDSLFSPHETDIYDMLDDSGGGNHGSNDWMGSSF